MPDKSVTPSIRMSQDEYRKLKTLKEKNNVSWTDFIKYANELISEDMKRDKK